MALPPRKDRFASRMIEGYGPYILLLLALILGSTLRFYRIGGQPLWLDEAWSHWFSTWSIHDLWLVIPRAETNPPFYYTLLKLWRYLFGSSEAGLRSLSAAMSIGCIPLLFLLGRLADDSASGRWVGAMAGLMFSVSPVHVQYAQEARAYAMLTFAVTLTLCVSVWVVRHPVEACAPITEWWQGSHLLPWLSAVVAVAFTIYLHNTSILFIFAIFLVVVAWFAFSVRFNRNFLVKIIIVFLAVVLLWSPYLAFQIFQAIGIKLPIPAPSVASIVNTVVWLLLGHSISWSGAGNEIIKMMLLMGLAILSLIGLLSLQKRSGFYVALLVFVSIIGPIILELLFSFLFQPIFVSRTLIYVSVPFYFAIAAGIMVLRNKASRLLLLLMITLISLKWTSTYFVSNEKSRYDPWDKIVTAVSRENEVDKVLFLPGYLEIPFSYYSGRMNSNYPLVPLPYRAKYSWNSEHGLDHLKADPLESLQIRTMDLETIRAVLENDSSVYLITRNENIFDPDGIVLKALQERYPQQEVVKFGEMKLFKFESSRDNNNYLHNGPIL